MKATQWLKVGVLLAPGIGLIVFFIGIVIYIAVAQSFGFYNMKGESTLSLEFWSSVSSKKSYFRSVMYSLYIGFTSAFLSVLLAYPLAIWLRKPFPGSMSISALLKAPLLIHGIVVAFLFVNVISYHGLLNQLMQMMGFWDGPRRLQNDDLAIGVLILQVWKNMPFALLLLTGSVQSIREDVLDAARDLGAGSLDRFKRVIAPLSLSALQASLVLVFIGALADYTFQTIVGPTSQQSLSQYMTFFSRNGRWNEAAVVAVTLMFLSLCGAVLLSGLMRLLLKRRR